MRSSNSIQKKFIVFLEHLPLVRKLSYEARVYGSVGKQPVKPQ